MQYLYQDPTAPEEARVQAEEAKKETEMMRMNFVRNEDEAVAEPAVENEEQA